MSHRSCRTSTRTSSCWTCRNSPRYSVQRVGMRCEASFQNGTLGKTWRRDERRFAISAPCCRDSVEGRGIYIPRRHYVVVTLLNSHICTASNSRVLFQEFEVESLQLPDVLIHAWAQACQTVVVLSVFLPETRTGYDTDTSSV